MTWQNALNALRKPLWHYVGPAYGRAFPQTNVDTSHIAQPTKPKPMPAETPQSGLYNTFLRRGLMIHNRDRDKAERWAAAHMAMHSQIYSGADE